MRYPRIDEWVKLIKMVATLAVGTAQNERRFSAIKLNTGRLRSRLGNKNLAYAMRVKAHPAVSLEKTLYAFVHFNGVVRHGAR